MNLAAMQRRLAARLVGHDQAAIPGIPDARLALASELLIRKRLGEVAPLLPRCRQALGPRFGELFRQFVRDHRPHGRDKPANDAIAFAAMIAAERTLPRRVRNLADYELAWNRAQQAAALVIAVRCPHLTDERPFVALWWRWHRRGALHHLRLPCG